MNKLYLLQGCYRAKLSNILAYYNKNIKDLDQSKLVYMIDKVTFMINRFIWIFFCLTSVDLSLAFILLALMIQEPFSIQLWISNLALYGSFIFYVAQNKQNCKFFQDTFKLGSINQLGMQVRGRREDVWPKAYIYFLSDAIFF